jgi:hypothetical protein
MRLEVSGAAVLCRARRRTTRTRRSGKRRSYQEVQELRLFLAEVLSGGSDLVEVGLDVLEHDRGKQSVREVRQAEKEEEVQKRDQEGIEAYCETVALSVNSGSAVASGSSSLATIS